MKVVLSHIEVTHNAQEREADEELLSLAGGLFQAVVPADMALIPLNLSKVARKKGQVKSCIWRAKALYANAIDSESLEKKAWLRRKTEDTLIAVPGPGNHHKVLLKDPK